MFLQLKSSTPHDYTVYTAESKFKMKGEVCWVVVLGSVVADSRQTVDRV